jgi:hypothetical protein
MITGEQIAAIDRAIVFLTHDNPDCRLHVGLDEIVVDCEDGNVREYDVYHEEYKTEWCDSCNTEYAPADMRASGKCVHCEEDE